jgi:hypothetical protein
MTVMSAVVRTVLHRTAADMPPPAADESVLQPPPTLASQRAPNRHLLQDRSALVPAGVFYTDFFKFVDDQLRPKAYFEVGTHLGRSVKAFSCPAVCVDPHFMLNEDVIGTRTQTHFYQMTSDAYFDQHDLRAIFKAGPDVCFLDGMHRSEYLLRDFLNTERFCHRRSVIFMHDCLPANTRMALRTHEPGDESEGHWAGAWTGDVWKIVPLLRAHRPDLKIFLLDCAPTGVVVVSNLNPASTILTEAYGGLVDKLREMDLEKHTISKLWDEVPVISSHSLMQYPEDLTLFFDFK